VQNAISPYTHSTYPLEIALYGLLLRYAPISADEKIFRIFAKIFVDRLAISFGFCDILLAAIPPLLGSTFHGT